MPIGERQETMKNEDKQLVEDINKVITKHKITKGILMLEMPKEEGSKETKPKVLVFRAGESEELNKEEKFNFHEFALFWERCIFMSKTIREISNHAAEHMVNKVLGGMVKDTKDAIIDTRLKKGTKRAD